MNCKNCGFEIINKNLVICPNCGMPLNLPENQPTNFNPTLPDNYQSTNFNPTPPDNYQPITNEAPTTNYSTPNYSTPNYASGPNIAPGPNPPTIDQFSSVATAPNNLAATPKKHNLMFIALIIIGIVFAISAVVAVAISFSNNNSETSSSQENLENSGNSGDSGNSENSGNNSSTISSLTLSVGDTFEFGSYTQNSETEPIEWIVLAKEDGKALVISKNYLDVQPYNSEATEVTWETSSLRAWLNDDFLNSAFSDGEKSLIVESEVENPGTYYGQDITTKEYGFTNDEESITEVFIYSSPASNSTTDYVFLLDVDEIKTYLTSETRYGGFTDYVKEKYISAMYEYGKASLSDDQLETYEEQYDSYTGDIDSEIEQYDAYWTRSSLSSIYQAILANREWTMSDGSIFSMFFVNYNFLVRPAMWLYSD